MNFKVPVYIPHSHEWIIVEDSKTIFKGYMRPIKTQLETQPQAGAN